MPEFELLPARELSEREKTLAEKIRSRGFDDQETNNEFHEWLTEQENWAQNMRVPRAVIEVELRKAELFYEAGLFDEAWDCLNDVEYEAADENNNAPDLLAIAEAFKKNG